MLVAMATLRRWRCSQYYDTSRRLASGYNHADSRVVTNLSAVITRWRDGDAVRPAAESTERQLSLSRTEGL